MKTILRRLNRYRKILQGREVDIVPVARMPTEFHGTSYGGWSIRKDSLGMGSKIVSVGIGEDASFDFSVIAKYQCVVYALDPTPKSIQWVQRNVSEPKFHFYPLALGNNDGTLRLYLPKNNNHVSASISAGKHSQAAYFDAQSIRLSSLIKKLSLTSIDVLKMDIEGAEYDVIQDSIQTGAISVVDQLLIEFHHFFSGFSPSHTKEAVASLAKVGLSVAWVSDSGHEVLFVREEESA